MKTQPSPQQGNGIELPDDAPQPIAIRKLDRLETTEPSSMNGG
jgi:hypothetical protein